MLSINVNLIETFDNHPDGRIWHQAGANLDSDTDQYTGATWRLGIFNHVRIGLFAGSHRHRGFAIADLVGSNRLHSTAPLSCEAKRQLP